MKNRQPWLAVGTAIAVMGLTAAVLGRAQGNRHLGEPGLKLVEVALADDQGGVAATNSIYLPESILDYRSELLPITRVELDWLPRDTTFGRRRYTGADGYPVQVSGVLMGSDRTSIHKPEYCLPGQGFQIVGRSERRIVIDRPHRYELPVMRLDARREVRRTDGSVLQQGAVYVYWFVSDTRLSCDHLERMWWLAVDLVRSGELQRWGYLSCLGACPPGQEDAVYARLERLIQALAPEIQTTAGPALPVSADAAPVHPPGIEIPGRTMAEHGLKRAGPPG